MNHSSESTGASQRRVLLRIRGKVQGVGFRPTIYRVVTARGCAGAIRNTPQGVFLDIEGPAGAVTEIVDEFRRIIPERARVDELLIEEAQPMGRDRFVIEPSATCGDSLLPIPPDLAMCPACKDELHEPANRRAAYPFNTCTACGPRFSIARAVPFDRPTSAMDEFPLCDACRAEYEAPEDRRFHAQTMSCPRCGPSLTWTPNLDELKFESLAPLDAARRALARGRIVAVKGLGGFHLACDATREEVVAELRKRKGRPHKPLAVMTPDIESCRGLCMVSRGEEELLRSASAPIVLLKKRPAAPLAAGVAPGLRHVGVMLAYTPLHHMLFDAPEMPPALIMTSCNRADEPIAISAQEVLERLGDIADAVLSNDRPIINRCDDSVFTFHARAPVPIRRSRGYVPEPILLARAGPSVFATGAMWKNAFALTSGRRAFLSQHIGDVSDADNAAHFEETFRRFSALLRLEPELIACDLHPDYPTTAFAQRLAEERGLPLVQVQHHHAHVAATLAEHRIEGRAIGVSMDGAGLGADGAIWGGEFFIADQASYDRKFHLRYVPMPGGEKAVLEPDRMALAHLTAAVGADEARARMQRYLGPERCASLLEIMKRRRYSPPTSSCGRLFDAVAALLDVRHSITYEGQAACELEAITDESERGSYAFCYDGGEIDCAPVFRLVCEDLDEGTKAPVIAARFHNAVVEMIREGCRRLREETGIVRVALSGGVMQNRLLVDRTVPVLRQEGFNVLLRRRVPPNDGGICLGQAACAIAQLSTTGG